MRKPTERDETDTWRVILTQTKLKIHVEGIIKHITNSIIRITKFKIIELHSYTPNGNRVGPSGAGRCILHLALQIATVFSGVVFDVAGGVVYAAPGVVDPVGTGWVEASEVAVRPGQGGDKGNRESTDGEEARGNDEQDDGGWNPDGA